MNVLREIKSEIPSNNVSLLSLLSLLLFHLKLTFIIILGVIKSGRCFYMYMSVMT